MTKYQGLKCINVYVYARLQMTMNSFHMNRIVWKRYKRIVNIHYNWAIVGYSTVWIAITKTSTVDKLVVDKRKIENCLAYYTRIRNICILFY